ncbi:hypothetical protein RFI_24947, partial [Reticulomyxa filosa]
EKEKEKESSANNDGIKNATTNGESEKEKEKEKEKEDTIAEKTTKINAIENEGNDDRDGAMSVLEFTKELEKYLHADLQNVNVMDFLKRWRTVELIEEDENDPVHNLVRLVPMGGCTVLLGNLPHETNESKIRELLELINPAWGKLRIRVHKDGKLAHAHIDFVTLHEAETAMTQIKRNKFYTPEIRVEIESTSGTYNCIYTYMHTYTYMYMYMYMYMYINVHEYVHEYV